MSGISHNAPRGAASLLFIAACSALPADAQQALPTIDIQAATPSAREAPRPSAGKTPPTSVIGQPPAPYAGGLVGSGARLGVLGNRNVFDTPFSLTGYTEKLVRDQQARTVTDVADNDSSIRTNAPRYGGIDGFLVRGFPVFAGDFAIDGLYGVADWRSQAIEPMERIEVLKGPSALLNGVPPLGTIGGAINLIPKRATDAPITRVTTSFASRGQLGTHVDVGRRFGPNNEWGIRFNGAYRKGSTPIDFQGEEFGVAALALDYRGDRLRVTTDLELQGRDLDAPTRQKTVSTGFPIPSSPSLVINPQQPWEYYNAHHWHGALRAEYDVSENATVYAAFGHSRFDELFFGGVLQIVNARGDFRTTPTLTPQDVQSNTTDIGLRTRFETGPIKHQLAASAVGLWQDTGITNSTVGRAITSNIFVPLYVPARSDFGLLRDAPRTAARMNRGVAIADTLSAFDDRALLTLGGRWQQIDVKNYNANTGLIASSSTNQAFSPAAGLVVKPIENLSLYANYIQGLTSGGIAPVNAVNAGEAFPAFIARQIEVGAKYDFGVLGLTFAAFDITQPSSFTDPTTRRFSVDGEQRNRGLEFNIFGEPLPGVRLLGGVTLLDGVLTKTASGTNNGKTAAGVPDVQLNLYGEYDLPFWSAPGNATLTGRVIYTSSQFYDQANTQSIPDWTRLDLGGRYTIDIEGRPVTLRLSVENVLDTNYWTMTGRGLLTAGAPRTFLVSTTVDF
ncbi:TonB-dependent siderophore receptor [Methylocystis sp. JR02]|uniref:TonB-dependent receptor n=1 Tax=Methylocystis sp. JR02 TaxID=3046284 RepID=UPI0024B8998E|nr:TonB-dependent siderophore receptor [Methylocystis sp. JR02]MDJ0450662.1 TonB-dependent siderophore receptor [Methylocystis sp. JR02]